MFIGPGVEVYEGMIVGANPKNEDIVVNVCKKKHATNTRASGSDEALKLVPHSQLSLEQCLEFIAEDELVEITPKSIRMRKMILSKELRMKQARQEKVRDFRGVLGPARPGFRRALRPAKGRPAPPAGRRFRPAKHGAGGGEAPPGAFLPPL